VKPHELKPARGSKMRRKRVGRGEGSGKGKTAGRGTKGTKARGKVSAFFEGGQMPLTRRVPKLKGFTPPHPTVYEPVNIKDLARLEASDVGPDELRAAGLITRRGAPVKVLGIGEIDRAVTVRAHAFSESAAAKISRAGGTVERIEDRSTGRKRAKR
jgi:large subunit ribosomal protein L15